MPEKTPFAEPITWLGDRVRILDQTRLPKAEVYLEIADYRELNRAICELKVRGAPAIGVAGAYAVVLGALQIKSRTLPAFTGKLRQVISEVGATRPTARNLFRALERMAKAAANSASIDQVKTNLVSEAQNIHREEIAASQKLSLAGARLIKDGYAILTHCNAGPLAATGYGTALGVIIRAHEQGRTIKVFATETRPLLQGARLTTWELMRAGIPVTLITDSMAGYFMHLGKIDCVIVGADRIAANGDTANKIGTYSLAVLAKANKVPFYIAAPTSTIDFSIVSGEQIPIEQRNPAEVTNLAKIRVAAPGCPAANPAFDVTPYRYIAAIITEKGILRPPFLARIQKLQPEKIIKFSSQVLTSPETSNKNSIRVPR